jgi:hypothetical protein
VSISLELVESERADAEGIVKCIMQTLKHYNLNISLMQGLGTDNASVMVGINNGVYQILKTHNPSLILIRCICHSMQLAISSASKELPRNLEFLIRETYD